jgi:Outer membrane protein beta-barrel family
MMKNKYAFFLLLTFALICTAQAQPNFRLTLSCPTDSQKIAKPFYITVLNNQKAIVRRTILRAPDTTLLLALQGNSLYECVLEQETMAYNSLFFRCDTIQPNSRIYKTFVPKMVTLSEVIVKHNTPYYKGDTLIIPVDSIKTRPHAAATELLNKVPGIDIGPSGDVKINGKKVDEVTVNGQRLFGGNARATLEAIKGDMIQQLEVLQRENSSGDKVPSLNLRLRKSRSQGWYGNTGILGGNNERYRMDFRLNYIKPSFFFNSFLNKNNINEKVLSEQSLYAFTNAFKKDIAAYSITEQQGQGNVSISSTDDNLFGSFFNQYGISNSVSGGSSISKTGKKNYMDGFVLAEKNDRFVLQEYYNKLYLAPFTQTDSSLTTERNQQTNAVANLSWHYFPSSQNTFKVAQMVRFSNEEITRNTNNRTTLNDADGNGLLRSLVMGFSNPNTKRIGLINQAMWLHRYKKTAYTFSAYSRYEFENNSFDHTYYNTGLGNNNQWIQREGQRHSAELQLVQSLPISRRILFEARANNRYDTWTADQNSYNFVASSGQYSQLLPKMSASPLRIDNWRTQISGSILWKKNKATLIGGLGFYYWQSVRKYNNAQLASKNAPLILPFILYKNRLKGNNSLILQYKPGWEVPAADQLTPLPDSSNIQQVRTGNPALDGTFRHAFNVNFSNTGKVGSVISATLQLLLNHNPIVPASTTDAQGKVSRSYEQYGNNKQINASLFWLNFNASKPFNVFSSILFSAASSYAINNQTVFKFTTLLGSLYVGGKWKVNKNIETEIKWQTSYSNYISDEGKRSDLRGNLTITLENTWPKDWYTTLDANMQFNGANTPGQKVNTFIRFDVAKYFTKQNRCRLMAGVRNLLNINNSVTFNQTATLQSVNRFNMLPRILSLSFTYFFDKWTGKD